MNRSKIVFTLSLLAVVTVTAARAQGGMPADCPMHAEHQKKAAEAAAAAAAGPATPVAPATPVTVADRQSAATDHAAHAGHVGSTSTNAQTSPYVALTDRAIAALSEEEIAALRAGTGHGLALPAEIHHYPGPRHVMDLGAELGLDANEKRELQAIYDRMHTDAVALGDTIIAREQELDRLFAEGHATAAAVERLTAEIAHLQGELRATHLVAHVEARALLTADQVSRYDALRGYGSAAGAP